jgi:hypothetical protein
VGRLGSAVGTKWAGWRQRPAASLAALLLAGLAVREALSFWTGAPYDFEIWIRTGYVVGHGTNPYGEFWPPVPGLSIAYFNRSLISATYLPFWPLYTGAAYRGYLLFGGGDRFVYYFLLKQGPILGDVLTAGLLYRVVRRLDGDPRLALHATALWSFFPYTILVSAVWGQFDAIAVAVVLASLLAVPAGRKNLLYGVGIVVKWVTAMFLPFDVFRRRGLARGWVGVAILVPAAVTAAVFLALGWNLSGLVSVARAESVGIGGGMNWARLVSPFGPFAVVGQAPFVTPVLELLWVPGVVLAGFVAARHLDGRGLRGELDAVVGIVATFLLLRWGLNEQYFLYLFAPLLVDVLVVHRERRALCVALIGLATAFLVINNTLLVPFLAPVGPQYVTWAHAANNAPGWDPLRLYTLDALAVLLTLTLAQLVYVVLARHARARPWFLDLSSLVRRAAGAEVRA